MHSVEDILFAVHTAHSVGDSSAGVAVDTVGIVDCIAVDVAGDIVADTVVVDTVVVNIAVAERGEIRGCF